MLYLRTTSLIFRRFNLFGVRYIVNLKGKKYENLVSERH
jgi:hypothetical protein